MAARGQGETATVGRTVRTNDSHEGGSAMRLNRHQRRATKKISRHSLWRPRLERLEDKLAPAVFTVVNTNDFGPGSLRQAMMDAETTANVNVNTPDEIHFAIPGT